MSNPHPRHSEDSRQTREAQSDIQGILVTRLEELDQLAKDLEDLLDYTPQMATTYLHQALQGFHVKHKRWPRTPDSWILSAIGKH